MFDPLSTSNVLMYLALAFVIALYVVFKKKILEARKVFLLTIVLVAYMGVTLQIVYNNLVVLAIMLAPLLYYVASGLALIVGIKFRNTVMTDVVFLSLYLDVSAILIKVSPMSIFDTACTETYLIVLATYMFINNYRRLKLMKKH